MNSPKISENAPSHMELEKPLEQPLKTSSLETKTQEVVQELLNTSSSIESRLSAVVQLKKLTKQLGPNPDPIIEKTIMEHLASPEAIHLFGAQVKTTHELIGHLDDLKRQLKEQDDLKRQLTEKDEALQAQQNAEQLSKAKRWKKYGGIIASVGALALCTNPITIGLGIASGLFVVAGGKAFLHGRKIERQLKTLPNTSTGKISKLNIFGGKKH